MEQINLKHNIPGSLSRTFDKTELLYFKILFIEGEDEQVDGEGTGCRLINIIKVETQLKVSSQANKLGRRENAKFEEQEVKKSTLQEMLLLAKC